MYECFLSRRRHIRRGSDFSIQSLSYIIYRAEAIERICDWPHRLVSMLGGQSSLLVYLIRFPIPLDKRRAADTEAESASQPCSESVSLSYNYHTKGFVLQDRGKWPPIPFKIAATSNNSLVIMYISLGAIKSDALLCLLFAMQFVATNSQQQNCFYIFVVLIVVLVAIVWNYCF